MVYGVFDVNGNHIFTFDYGNNCKSRAEESALKLSIAHESQYYARELTNDEYFKRLKEIHIEGKYK